MTYKPSNKALIINNSMIGQALVFVWTPRQTVTNHEYYLALDSSKSWRLDDNMATTIDKDMTKDKGIYTASLLEVRQNAKGQYILIDSSKYFEILIN